MYSHLGKSVDTVRLLGYVENLHKFSDPEFKVKLFVVD